MPQFLDQNLCDDFRKAINDSPIFYKDEKLKRFYDLFCAVMDRLDSSISYLNEHSKMPKSETEFVVFVMFGCMAIDTIKKIHRTLGLSYKYKNPDDLEKHRYFGTICKNSPLNLSDDECPTDDLFFEYFRSLVFAHPVDTDRAPFLKSKGEKHYSPWVIVNNMAFFAYGIKDGVGVRIYSNLYDDGYNIKDLYFSFSVLKDYIKSRYELIEQATGWVRSQIANSETLWKQRKVDRSLTPIETLRDVANVLKSRYVDCYDIDEAIICLTCESSVAENNVAAMSFRNAIIEIVPSICDAVDSLDNETWADLLDNVLYARPKKMHAGANYQLEKIFTDRSNWRLIQADEFSKEFSKNHVTINPYAMSDDEIKMLVRTACYLEMKAQGERS